MADGPPGQLADAVRASGMDATDRPGEAADAPTYRMRPERTVELLAAALARLHAVPPPPDVVPLDALGLADVVRERQRLGALSPPGAASEYAHVSLDRLVEVLVAGAPDVLDRGGPASLCHGSPTLARLRALEGQLVGFVDWRRATVADPYLDLAVAARSVATGLTPMLVPVLFERYGPDRPDPVRLDWWALAAELLGAPSPSEPGHGAT